MASPCTDVIFRFPPTQRRVTAKRRLNTTALNRCATRKKYEETVSDKLDDTVEDDLEAGWHDVCSRLHCTAKETPLLV